MEGYLVLEDGTSFSGELDGREGCTGEVVFFTGMTGYQEVLTDPSYKGQIIVFTYPLIGNYGINASDFESRKPQVRGVVVYEACGHFSHHQATKSLRDYLKNWNVPLLSHVDTRAVVKHIRAKGTLNAVLTVQKDSLPASRSRENVAAQAAGQSGTGTFGDGPTHIALIDFGYKKSIASSLAERGCKVTVVRYQEMDSVLKLNPDGVVLSNGPGDPKAIMPYMDTLRNIIASYPTLGICLGHQLIALAFGSDTYKLPFGHRGANHPVMDRETGRVFMTSQNHSYVVDEATINRKECSVRFHHVNDGSVEGLVHNTLPVMSVQFHPEAHPGPAESEWIFNEYMQKLNEARREIAHA
ncbi:carbamoyl phosphate synthase small subunit [Bacillus sonorensis]|uniref:Carbamoyl phosphate synthase small chain n=2 Tax=Bacillus sonorensis TaxID=119858 RepID=M5P7W5_9BACI|nr:MULTISPECIES: carbamoyl phosphate synthase small subunit [Bacillus]TWK72835.1 Carbamoyl-phosphate synthase arginine-specific small chain [Bacillus paralicheniformis]ASB90138.1 Carbamoyl-phosphate synthase (glutamine-hydrolyzing) [Bacillus sonorensis]EME76091.1 carbamoyl phosphate synthase small subunit [Bacillus sonorensis L12]MCZ0074559.1 carbamoyl phosphate synthase small subunit [Bacillus sonorensis]MCZ0093667.1 carbamoyl phosphate synthase small subunit [Bacillus sonorensis]